jgi:hypothetical protein
MLVNTTFILSMEACTLEHSGMAAVISAVVPLKDVFLYFSYSTCMHMHSLAGVEAVQCRPV